MAGDPLDFWSALNGQTTTEFLDQGAVDQITAQRSHYYDILTDPRSTPQQKADATAGLDAIDRQQSEFRDQSLQGDIRRTGQQAEARHQGYTDKIDQTSAANDIERAGWAQGGANAWQQQTAANGQLFQGLESGRSAADARDAATMGRYGSALDTANNVSAQGLSNLQSRYDDYGILQANPYQGDAASNPEDIARQQASYDTLGGWASGANNISSDPGLVGLQMNSYDQLGGWASGANDISSDAGLVGQQQDVYGQFNDWASGAHDISSDPGLVGMQQGVYDDYGQFASGAMDLESQAAHAQADPEAVAAQKEALGEFRDRMDPKLTDAERFLYMQSRLAQEQSQRAVRDANYRELERRGMGGSTMALSNLNASSAEASNTRALQDLGANAKAVDRAEKALVNYGNMSSTMREQSFSEDFATKSAADRMAVNNNQQRLQGIAGQGQMANAMRAADDDIKKFNSTQQMQGLQGAGMMANTMRSQDDAMRQGNANRRLEGTVQQGNLASTMRGQDDAIRTGNANRQLAGAQAQGEMATSMRNAGDALNMFNKEQQGIQLRHEDDFRAHQQDAAWGRDTDMNNAMQGYANGLTEREGGYARTAIQQSDNEFSRLGKTTETGIGINRDYVEGYDRLRTGAGQDRRDKMTELGAGSDSDYQGAQIAGRANDQIAGIQQGINRNKDEDARADSAIRHSIPYTPPEPEDKQDPFKGENWA